MLLERVAPLIGEEPEQEIITRFKNHPVYS